jgi:hypothetical protein
MELDQLHEGLSQGYDPARDTNPEGTRHPGTALSGETAQRQRIVAAARVGSLATAAHHAASDLEQDFPQTAQYIHDAAAGFERISNLLRDPNLDEVASLIGNLGRRQPAAIVAGIVLIGLGLSWLLSKPGDNTAHTAARVAGEGAYGVH